ncbi:hypothetical protein KP509_1Z063700 [Ceratopteris richardii]|nr:hypothetical protein KP509_1Z063700 [Ceratopteris richardii]
MRHSCAHSWASYQAEMEKERVPDLRPKNTVVSDKRHQAHPILSAGLSGGSIPTSSSMLTLPPCGEVAFDGDIVSPRMRLLYDYRAPAGTRWSPTAEQLRELLALFHIGGIRTPTTAQISHITARLRGYGRIEGRNVFYWFQNQKARERKRRLQLLQKSDSKRAGPSNESSDQRSDRSLQQERCTENCQNRLSPDPKRCRRCDLQDTIRGDEIYSAPWICTRNLEDGAMQPSTSRSAGVQESLSNRVYAMSGTDWRTQDLQTCPSCLHAPSHNPPAVHGTSRSNSHEDGDDNTCRSARGDFVYISPPEDDQKSEVSDAETNPHGRLRMPCLKISNANAVCVQQPHDDNFFATCSPPCTSKLQADDCAESALHLQRAQGLKPHTPSYAGVLSAAQDSEPQPSMSLFTPTLSLFPLSPTSQNSDSAMGFFRSALNHHPCHLHLSTPSMPLLPKQNSQPELELKLAIDC